MTWELERKHCSIMVKIKTQLKHNLNIFPQHSVLVHTDSANQLQATVTNQLQTEAVVGNFKYVFKPLERYIS